MFFLKKKLKKNKSKNKVGLKANENSLIVSPQPSSPIIEDPIESNESCEESETEILEDVQCSCGEHDGKQMLNIKLNYSVEALYDCIFNYSDFCRKYWKARKIANEKLADWVPDEAGLQTRRIEYTIDIGALGNPLNIEYQVTFKLINKSF